MIKECNVITRNAINMVVIYDGNEVQIPTDNTCNDTVYINKVANGFTLSSSDEFLKSNKKNEKKISVAELASINENATDTFAKQ